MTGEPGQARQEEVLDSQTHNLLSCSAAHCELDCSTAAFVSSPRKRHSTVTRDTLLQWKHPRQRTFVSIRAAAYLLVISEAIKVRQLQACIACSVKWQCVRLLVVASRSWHLAVRVRVLLWLRNMHTPDAAGHRATPARVVTGSVSCASHLGSWLEKSTAPLMDTTHAHADI